jgi:hypothetical protein
MLVSGRLVGHSLTRRTGPGCGVHFPETPYIDHNARLSHNFLFADDTAGTDMA